MTGNARKYRWVAPDGRRGRWRKTLTGAVISAVSAYYSQAGGSVSIRVSVDAAIAAIMWPGLQNRGWVLEFCQ